MKKMLRQWIADYALYLRGFVVEVFEDRKEVRVHNAYGDGGVKSHSLYLDDILLRLAPSDAASKTKAVFRQTAGMSDDEIKAWDKATKRWNDESKSFEIV